MQNAEERIKATTGLAANAVIDPEIADDIASFEQNEFTGPIRLYSPDEAAEILKGVRVNNQKTDKILYPNNMNYDRHFDIPEMARHICHPTILKYLKGILGPDMLLWRTEFFAKFPGSPETEWHQVRDYAYTQGQPLIKPTLSDWNAYIDITVWTTFTPATLKTGCMRFIPGSHRENFYDEYKSVATGRNGSYKYENTGTGFFGYKYEEFKTDPDWDPEKANPVDLEMDAGEAVIFTASCVHGAYGNTTERDTRFAITSRYVPTHVRIYPDMPQYNAHGETFDLTNYSTVLVSGENEYDFNKVRTEDNHGKEFSFG